MPRALHESRNTQHLTTHPPRRLPGGTLRGDLPLGFGYGILWLELQGWDGEGGRMLSVCLSLGLPMKMGVKKEKSIIKLQAEK